MGVRFAPSPTGRFHLGNLRTAWISHWWSRQLGLPWVLRFEDIDTPRVIAGAMETQLEDLRALGLTGDEVIIQSQRHARHFSLFETARQSGVVYPCHCSRKEIQRWVQQASSAPHSEPPIYDGRCRDGSTGPSASHPTIAWRFRGSDPTGCQDFVAGRTDSVTGNFTPSYQWACAIDDYDGAYLLLVRAWDLAHALTQQRAIHSWLSGLEGFHAYPAVFHTSLVVQDSGARLEKRTSGVTLPSLLEGGIDVKSIEDRFRRSFRGNSAEFESEKSWGEADRRITLRELGFR